MSIKLFRVISPLPGGKWGTLCFPTMALGTLFRSLTDPGLDVVQDDLHARWYHQVSAEDTRRLNHVAADEQRLWSYLTGEEDPDWDWFVEQATGLTDFGAKDILLLSMISGNPSTCRAALALAHYLKSKDKTVILGGEYYAHAPIHYVIKSGVRT